MPRKERFFYLRTTNECKVLKSNVDWKEGLGVAGNCQVNTLRVTNKDITTT